MRGKILAVIITVTVAAALACSDKAPLFDEMHRGQADVLERIEIQADGAAVAGDAVSITDRSSLQLHALGHYNDKSVKDITDQCSWTSWGDPGVALIDINGMLQVKKYTGSMNVTASKVGVSRSLAVNIDIKLSSITVEANPPILYATNESVLTATGKLADGTTLDATGMVTWQTDFDKGNLYTVGTSKIFRASLNNDTAKVWAEANGVTSNKAAITFMFQELYVDGSFPAGGDGSQNTPKKRIKDAIALAKAIGATFVKVAKGTYVEDLVIDADVSLWGGYVPTYDGKPWNRDPDPAKTTIQAAGNTAILYTNGLTSATSLDRFTVMGGSGGSMTSGITCQGSSPSIQYCNVYGGTSTNKSVAINCQGSSPVITKNKIYGGSSGGMSIGIYTVSSSPIILDNSEISGGLENYMGGGPDNIAILCQSGSNPTIEGSTVGAQFINGPGGGLSTCRIKCENTSNATIRQNIVEVIDAGGKVTSAKGILANNSSPTIDANVIQTKNAYDIAVRGDNTSFHVTGNVINGSIIVASSSDGAVIDGNKLIGGGVEDPKQKYGIIVTTNSKNISIMNHYSADPAKPNYSANYGVNGDPVIKGGIAFDVGSGGTLTKNVSEAISIEKGSDVTIYDSFIIITDTTCGINMYDSTCSVFRTFICVQAASNNSFTAGISASGGSLVVENCIIYVYEGGNSFTYGIGTDGYIYAGNNILAVRSGGMITRGVNMNGINGLLSNFYNNIIWLDAGTSRIGIFNSDETTHAYHMRGNFIRPNVSVYHGPPHSPEVPDGNYDEMFPTTDDLGCLGSTHYSDNWQGVASFDFAGGTGFPSPGSAFTFDFHITTGSLMYRRATDNEKDELDWNGHTISNLDFRKCERNISVGSDDTSKFSVGPYEPYSDEAKVVCH